MATVKTVNCVSDIAAILQQQFIHGFYNDRMPIVVRDPHGTTICEIKKGDEKKWARTSYEYSFAASRKLCTRVQWNGMTTAQQVELCNCWEELAIEEYLRPAFDAGVEFDIEDE